MISKVRQVESSEELTAMQCEVDGVLREALESYDDGAIDEATCRPSVSCWNSSPRRL